MFFLIYYVLIKSLALYYVIFKQLYLCSNKYCINQHIFNKNTFFYNFLRLENIYKLDLEFNNTLSCLTVTSLTREECMFIVKRSNSRAKKLLVGIATERNVKIYIDFYK